jgi:hypothetical protein
MRKGSSILTLLGLALVACEPLPISQGTISICSSIESSGESSTTSLSGTITAIGDSSSECAQSITITKDNGDTETIGLTLVTKTHPHRGSISSEITPPFDVEIGDSVDLSFHYLSMFGYTTGFILEDEDGLIMAADEGGWGGALADVEKGFTVTRAEEPFQITRTDCLTVESYQTIFEGDQSVEIYPLETEAMTVNGQSLYAHAVRAEINGPGKRCEMSDRADQLSWVVYRYEMRYSL